MYACPHDRYLDENRISRTASIVSREADKNMTIGVFVFVSYVL